MTSRQPLWILLIRLINENNPPSLYPSFFSFSFPLPPSFVEYGATDWNFDAMEAAP